MPPKLAATFQKVHLSAYVSGSDFTGLTDNQAAPKSYVDYAIANATSSTAVNDAISGERAARIAADTTLSGLILGKASLTEANTFTAANTFEAGLTISAPQYLYFGTNWRVGGVANELKFQYAVSGDFTDPEEIVFTTVPAAPVELGTISISGFDGIAAEGTLTITAAFVPEDSVATITPGDLSITSAGSTSTTAPGETTLYTLTVTNSSCDPSVVTSAFTFTPAAPLSGVISIAGFDGAVADGMLTITAAFSPEDSVATITPGDLSITSAGSTSTTIPDVTTVYTLTVTNSACDPSVVTSSYTYFVPEGITSDITTAPAGIVISGFNGVLDGGSLTFSAEFFPGDSTASISGLNLSGELSISSGGSVNTTEVPSAEQDFILTVTNASYDPAFLTQTYHFNPAQ